MEWNSQNYTILGNSHDFYDWLTNGSPPNSSFNIPILCNYDADIRQQREVRKVPKFWKTFSTWFISKVIWWNIIQKCRMNEMPQLKMNIVCIKDYLFSMESKYHSSSHPPYQMFSHYLVLHCFSSFVVWKRDRYG